MVSSLHVAVIHCCITRYLKTWWPKTVTLYYFSWFCGVFCWSLLRPLTQLQSSWWCSSRGSKCFIYLSGSWCWLLAGLLSASPCGLLVSLVSFSAAQRGSKKVMAKSKGSLRSGLWNVCITSAIFYQSKQIRITGGLSWLSVRLVISAQVMI